MSGFTFRGPQPPDLPYRPSRRKPKAGFRKPRARKFGPRKPGKRDLARMQFGPRKPSKRELGEVQPKKRKIRLRRKRGSDWLLRLVRRKLKQALLGRRQGPTSWRNHGYKGVTRQGRTGLGGR